MKHAFFVYPAGVPGSALMVLRASAVLFLASVLLRQFPWQPFGLVAAVLLGLSISIGFWTRMSSSVAAVIAAGLAWDAGGAFAVPLLAHMLSCVALVMVGPGAFSIDARRFGRRTVRLSD
jgi:putative oxidoreductase